MNEITKHGIASFVILLFCTIFFIDSLTFSSTAAYLPRIIIVLICILAVIMFIQAIRTHKRDAKKVEEKAAIHTKRVVIFVVLIGLYIALIEPIGYFIITPIFAIVSLLYLTNVQFRNVVFISVGFTIGIYIIFVSFLKIPIPMGLLS